VAATVLTAALVGAAESAAVLSASAVHRSNAQDRRIRRARAVAVLYGGEPELPSASRTASGPWIAAVTFVRDYGRWSDGQLPALPAEDGTPRVIRLLDRQGRRAGVDPRADAGSLRIAPAGARRYVVTSPVGNFLVGRRGGRWLVVSLPGD
jgi:hypothetical protein